MSLKPILFCAALLGMCSNAALAATTSKIGLVYTFSIGSAYWPNAPYDVLFSGRLSLYDTNDDGIIDSTDKQQLQLDQPTAYTLFRDETSTAGARFEFIQGPFQQDENFEIIYPSVRVADLKPGDELDAQDFLVGYTYWYGTYGAGGGAEFFDETISASGYVDLMPVPAPAAGALFGSALLALGALRRRR